MWLVIKTIHSGLGVLTRGCFDFPSLSGYCIPCKPDLIWFINEVCLCFGKHSQEIYRVKARTLAPSPWVTILITGETERQLGQVYLMHKVHKVNCVITIFLFDLNAIVNSTARGNDGNIGHYNDCSRSGRVAEHARNFLCK